MTGRLKFVIIGTRFIMTEKTLNQTLLKMYIRKMHIHNR